MRELLDLLRERHSQLIETITPQPLSLASFSRPAARAGLTIAPHAGAPPSPEFADGRGDRGTDRRRERNVVQHAARGRGSGRHGRIPRGLNAARVPAAPIRAVVMLREWKARAPAADYSAAALSDFLPTVFS